MNELKLSPTGVLRYDTCPRQALFYLQGWRTKAKADALVFGSVVHEVLAGYHAGTLPPDQLGAAWDQKWSAAITQPIAYGAERTPEGLRQTGAALFAAYHGVWQATGLQTLRDDQGPCVERRLFVRLPRAQGLFEGVIDLVATRDGPPAIVDHKSPGAKPDPNFAEKSDQLLAYQALFDANAPLHGLGLAAQIGFAALVKRAVPKTSRGTGPEVLPPLLVERRPAAEVAAYWEKVTDTASAMRAGSFRRRSLAEHNSPCKLCEYEAACWRNDFTGLTQGQDRTLDL